MGFLAGKRALIVGVASQRSIANGIAEAMRREGAELAFTYQNDKLKSRVEEAAAEYGSNIVLPLDVADDAQIDSVFAELGKHWDGLDILVHSVGFAPRETFDGGFLDHLTRESFAIALDISTYSLAALSKAARPMMANRNGAIIGGFTMAPGGKRVVVVSVLDNLLKGAASQALQNLNLAFGFDELTGIDP